MSDSVQVDFNVENAQVLNQLKNSTSITTPSSERHDEKCASEKGIDNFD